MLTHCLTSNRIPRSQHPPCLVTGTPHSLPPPCYSYTVLTSLPQPDPFLDIRIHHLDTRLGLTGPSVGYERQSWRRDQFADHIIEWLPEFALSPDEALSIHSSNAVSLLRKAARSLYATDKYQKRGEFGELILHILLRQVFSTLPAISKLYYKDSANDTVKGFDAVHVVVDGDDLELWIGEAKFYTNIRLAIASVVREIRAHTKTNYLRQEFALIGNKVSPSWPAAAPLMDLLRHSRSLDDVFSRLCIPVLLTYDSPVVDKHNVADCSYWADLRSELCLHYRTFSLANLPSSIRIHLFLLPLKKKSELVHALHQRLEAWQNT